MTEQTEKPQILTTSTATPTPNEQQAILVQRLKEAELSLNRFFRVKDNKAPAEPQGYMEHLKTPEEMTQEGSIRWGICGGSFLVPIDTDDRRMYEALSTVLPETFEVTSPRRGLPHKYFVVYGAQDVGNYTLHIPGVFDEEGKLKAMGEIRSKNQYLVAPGTEITFKDRETNEQKTGMYTVSNNLPIAKIEYNAFMNAVKPFIEEDNGNYSQRITPDQMLNGVSEGERHAKALRYADHLLGKGAGLDITNHELHRFNEKCQPSMLEADLQHILEEAVNFIVKQKDVSSELVIKGWDEHTFSNKPSLSEQPQIDATTTQEHITLKEVKETFKKWLYLEGDDEVIDVIIAGSIDRRVKGDPLWLLLISPSGGTKTEIVRNIKNKDIYTLDSVTAHSFISGKIDKDDDGNPIPVTGILKEIDGKILIIKDFTVLLGKRREDRDEIFSQLRSLYDGYIEFAFGTSPTPIRIEAKIGLIAAVTPAIDAFTKVYLQLGERFLKIRHHPDAKKATHKALSNLGKEDQMRTEITAKTTQFLASLQINDLPLIPEAYSLLIEDIALTVAILRTPVPMNIWKFEMNNTAEPITEYPTRLVKQLMKLAYSLSIIRGKTEVTIEEIKTVKRVARDTCVPNRVLIIDALMPKTEEEAKSFTTREISQKSKIPLTTCWRELKEMEILYLVEYNKTEQQTGNYNNTKHTPENDGWKLLNIELANILEKTETPTISSTIPCFTSVPPEYTIKINKVNDDKCEQQGIPIGYVSETPQNKPRFFVKEIPPGAKCDGCGKYVVTKEIITPQHKLIKRCDSCLKKLQETFEGAEFCPAYPDLEGREA